MKELEEKLEELLIDLTFAEEREFSNARNDLRMLAEDIQCAFTAIAFAEVGEFEAAASCMDKDGKSPKSRPGYVARKFTGLCADTV